MKPPTTTTPPLPGHTNGAPVDYHPPQPYSARKHPASGPYAAVLPTGCDVTHPNPSQSSEK